MEYFVRQVVDWHPKREFWALIDRKRMLELKDIRPCEEDDIKAVASSKAELELKMALMGLEFKDVDNFCRMTSTETWTAWIIGKAASDD